VTVRAPNRERQHDQGEDGQQVDWAPLAPNVESVNEEGTDGDRSHKANPEPAECSLRQRAFGRDELNKPERKGQHGGEGVNLNRWGS
jgi:hypothetical protein